MALSDLQEDTNAYASMSFSFWYLLKNRSLQFLVPAFSACCQVCVCVGGGRDAYCERVFLCIWVSYLFAPQPVV